MWVLLFVVYVAMTELAILAVHSWAVALQTTILRAVVISSVVVLCHWLVYGRHTTTIHK